MIASPVRSIAAQFVLAIVLGCSASIAHALVYFPVLGGYDQVGQGIVFVADAIVNDDATHSSQPLRMELWASPSPFPSADPDTSYRLAQVELQALPPGGQYTNYMSSVQPLGSLPNGTWYISVLLTEFVESGFDDGYAVDDWISFPDPVLIGPSQGVQPIIEYYYAASNTFSLPALHLKSRRSIPASFRVGNAQAFNSSATTRNRHPPAPLRSVGSSTTPSARPARISMRCMAWAAKTRSRSFPTGISSRPTCSA